jgi:ABC-2 type transport system ATP-binding protein
LTPRRAAAWDVISSLRDLGKTIFLTTHYMEEAERLADRIAVIVRGRIVAEGTGADIGKRATKGSTVSFTLPPGVSGADLPPTVACAVVACRDGRVEAKASSALPLVGHLAAWAKERHADLRDLEVTRPTLEDIYLELTEERP